MIQLNKVPLDVIIDEYRQLSGDKPESIAYRNVLYLLEKQKKGIENET